MTHRLIINLLLPGMLVLAAISTRPASLFPEIVLVNSFTSARFLRELAALWKRSFRAPANSPSILVILSWLYAPMPWPVPSLVPMTLTWPRPLSLVVLSWDFLDWRRIKVIAFTGASTISHCISWGALSIVVVLRWIPSCLRWPRLFWWISLCAMQFASSLTLTAFLASAWTRRWPATTLSSFSSTNRGVFRRLLRQGELLPSCFLLQRQEYLRRIEWLIQLI